MDVRAGLGAVVLRCPRFGIDGFAEAEIECELWDDLPTETDIRASAETVRRRNREGIKDVVLVGIDAVIPFASVESLKPEAQGYWCMVYGVWCKVVRYILPEADAVRLNIIGVGSRAERPTALLPIEGKARSVGRDPFLLCTSTQRDIPIVVA